MTVGESVAASAARPDVFHPMKRVSIDGVTEELVDGAVACSNPTLYAYNMAKNLYGYENVRILSLGSTHQPFEMFKPSAFSTDSKYIERGAMTENMMAYTADYFVSYNDFNDWNPTTKKWALSDDYLRVDGVGRYDGRDASSANITKL
jgi:patatin-like phospholipase/acyl hydrolase